MAHDEAVVVVIALADGAGESLPVRGAEARAVETVELQAVDLAQLTDARDGGEQLLTADLRGQSVGRHLGGNRAAGADHENMLHMTSLQVAVIHRRKAEAHRLFNGRTILRGVGL